MLFHKLLSHECCTHKFLSHKLWLAIVLLAISLSSQASALDNLQKTLNAHQGEVIYLDFWASWCVPCRKSFPWLNMINKRYAGKDFQVISVNVDADSALAEKFLFTMPAQFPVVYDPDGEIAEKFKLKGMPSSFLINKQGKIVVSHIGFFENKKPEYEQQILTLLKAN